MSGPEGSAIWRYEHPIEVVADDIDAMGHANNVVYLRWAQEAATAHWLAAVPAEVARRTAWAVVRHEIDYKAPAFLGERLVVRTWVGMLTGATFERFCEVHRPADGRLLARARTVWCVVDPSSGRPRRIDPGLVDHFKAEGRAPGRVEGQEPGAEGQEPRAKGKGTSAEGREPSAEGREPSAGNREGD